MKIHLLLNTDPAEQPATITGPTSQGGNPPQSATRSRSPSLTELDANKRRKTEGQQPRQPLSLVPASPPFAGPSTAAPSSPVQAALPTPSMIEWLDTLGETLDIHEARQAFEINRGPMTQRLLSRQLHVVPNHGGAANNCLIISLLQHATRNYSSEHVNAAADVRRALAAAHPTVSLDEPLHSDDAAARWLIEHVVQNHARGRDMQVFFLEPGQDGQPIPRIGREGSGPAVGIANWGVHFEAVMNLSDTDLITHLVDMAPQSSRRQDDETMRSHAQRLMREDPLVLA